MRPKVIHGSPAAWGAFQVARLLGDVSRVWGQRGLGTIYNAFNRVRPLERLRCQVEFDRESRFELPVFDSYWAPTIIGGRPYEPELMHVVRRLRDLSPAPVFVDCGANYGYWSIIASGPLLSLPKVIAIEANPVTYRYLARNAALNGDRFACLNYAVSDHSGEEVRLGQGQNERDHAQTFVDANAAAGAPTVETITLDEAIARQGWSAAGDFVLKLDVEGHEEKAIRGCAKLREQNDHLIVFEDFARVGYPQLASVLRDGYQVYFVTTGGDCHPLTSVEQATRIARWDHKEALASNLVAAREGSRHHRWLNRWAGL